jgi:transcriptional regulator with PAS, ATPase and Fis domain
MSDLHTPSLQNSVGSLDSNPQSFPLPSIIRALNRSVKLSPEVLYEVMLKSALCFEGIAQSYGVAIFTQKYGDRPVLKWVEGLDQDEIGNSEGIVSEALFNEDRQTEIREGDTGFTIVLAIASPYREGAAIYCRCIHPLTAEQASELTLLSNVVELAHGYARVKDSMSPPKETSLKMAASSTLPGMVYVSRSMADLCKSVERIKDSESTVLINGESGTGKELVARAIHRMSRRSQAPFIPFNCTAAPADLIESLLFGHRKGAFTGAHMDQVGLIRAAEGGTLFLDEIGDLPLMLQPKLLRFLQEGEVHTLGERAPRKVNVRVVAATHKDLEQQVREGQFREDLFYRVATLAVHVPALRDRPEDITALISHYLTYFARKNDHSIAGISNEAIRVLQSYAWPGNVRELAAEIERLVLYTEPGAFINAEQISPRILPRTAAAAATQGSSSESSNLDNMMEDFERHVITETLKRNDYNVARTANALGLGSRQTLYKKLKRLAINVGDFLQDENEPV